MAVVVLPLRQNAIKDLMRIADAESILPHASESIESMLALFGLAQGLSLTTRPGPSVAGRAPLVTMGQRVLNRRLLLCRGKTRLGDRVHERHRPRAGQGAGPTEARVLLRRVPLEGKRREALRGADRNLGGAICMLRRRTGDACSHSRPADREQRTSRS